MVDCIVVYDSIRPKSVNERISEAGFAVNSTFFS